MNKLQLLSPFLQELQALQPISAEEIECLVGCFEIVHVAKDQTILSEGEICRHAWVVLQGTVRAYHYVGEAEVTSRLMQPHHIIISVESFYTQVPASESLQAIQPSVLACLPATRLEEIYHKFPALNYIGRKLTEHYLLLTEQRLYLLRKQKAVYKYRYFLQRYPMLANEISLKYIASYLGINQETLSRVRSKLR